MNPTHVFVAYAKCGQCMTGAAVDFGKNDPEDAAMLMTALREGCKVGYVPVEQARKISFGCDGHGSQETTGGQP